MLPRHQRILLIAGLLLGAGAATALVFNAMRSNMVFFYSPTQVAAQEAPAGRHFRLGGLVQPGSLQRDGVQVRFVVTDTAQTVPVRYEGALPDLFKEGKGVVAQGQLQGGVFIAREVLAKHDENYMPPEAGSAVAQAQAAAHQTAGLPGETAVRAVNDAGHAADASAADQVRANPNPAVAPTGAGSR